MKYLLVFNPKAKRYSREVEASIIEQASRILQPGTMVTAYTELQPDGQGTRYDIADFEHCGRDADCVVAVGGDGTVNIVLAALARRGLQARMLLGVMPYGTGNNLVRSFGLKRESEKALLTIRQGYTVRLDIGMVNQRYYCLNASFGLFAHLLANRVTNSLVGYTYEAFRHLGFRTWPTSLRYLDAAGQMIAVPAQPYMLGAMLNTSHYASILRMAPEVVSDDGLFDVTLIRAVPVLAYPLLFTALLMGQRALLARNTMTFRAARIELSLDPACRVETDGDLLPSQQHYRVEIAGRIHLIVPSAHGRAAKPPQSAATSGLPTH